MAYIDFSKSPKNGEPQALAMLPAPTMARAAAFSGLEWSVIALARRDRLASLGQPGRIAAALASLFGGGQNPPLADERLERLRRMAVLAWHHGYVVPMSELRAFLASGFTIDHYELLQASIGFGRTERRRSGR